VGPEQKEAVAVIQDDAITVLRGHIVEPAADCGVCVSRGPEEELGDVEVEEVEEQAGQRGREEVQQTASVDDGMPGLADAASRREAMWRKAAEEGHQHVLG